MSKTHFDLLTILEALNKIENYSTPFNSAEDFYHDEKSFDASMMQFIIIGETISRLNESFKKSHSEIPWQKIKDFRNIIAHDYFGIDADEIWDIIQTKLLPLKKEIETLAQETL